MLYDQPGHTNDVPARKAIAWAMENTGTPKEDVEKQILKALRF